MSGDGPADDAAREAVRRFTENMQGAADSVAGQIAAVRREIGKLDRAELDRHVVADHPDLGALDDSLRGIVALFPRSGLAPGPGATLAVPPGVPPAAPPGRRGAVSRIGRSA